MKRFLLASVIICVAFSLYADDKKEEKEENKVWLGVILQAAEGGLKITEVIEDSPAHKGKVKIGDLVIKIGGEETNDLEELHKVLAGKKPGDRLKLIVKRGEKKEQVELTVKLAKRGRRDASSIAKSISSGMKEKKGKHYRILSNMDKKFVKEASEKMERMFKAYCEFYDVKPKLKEKLLIIVFKKQSQFKKFIGMTRGISNAASTSRAFGFFEFAIEGRPVVSRWIGAEDYSRTLANLGHEGAHQFFWTFVLDKVSVMHVWFDEGLAVNFEVENPYTHNTRFWYLKDSLAKNELISLAELIGNWTKHFSKKRMLCYNECGGFVHFLTRESSPYRKGFFKFLKGVNDKKLKASSVEDLEKSLGKKISEIEEEFKKWVRETKYEGPRSSGK
jgi:hypothetical protein